MQVADDFMRSADGQKSVLGQPLCETLMVTGNVHTKQLRHYRWRDRRGIDPHRSLGYINM